MTKIKKPISESQRKLNKILNSRVYKTRQKNTMEMISNYITLRYKRDMNQEERRIAMYLAENWPDKPDNNKNRRQFEELDIALKDANVVPKDSIKY